MKLRSETALNLGLTLLLSFSVAYFISSLALLKVEPCFRVSLPLTPKTSERAPELSYSLEREGFFLSKGGKKEEKVREEQQVVTAFRNYTLKGTVVCSKCGHSIAILKDSSGKTVIVSEGEEIGGYTLKKVYPEEVVLVRGKRELILQLKGKEEHKGKRGETVSSGRESYTVKRSEIIEQISSGDFLKYISIVPIKNPQGLKVNYVNPRSFIYKLGIRPGDVILSINEIRIKSPEDSFAAFEKLKSADSITITVLRRGKEVKLHYEIE